MKKGSLHILIATDGDLELLEKAIREQGSLDWIAPKGAEPGDDCLFSHMGRGLFASGQIASAPIPDTSGYWPGRYMANTSKLRHLSREVPHEELVDRFPLWKWPTYPRMYTSPPPDIAGALLAFLDAPERLVSPEDDSASLPEGGIQLRAHLMRERDPDLVARKKKQVMAKRGVLACEVCGFDFAAIYGERGKGFCEVHHLLALGERDGPTTTSMNDLAIVCSNCHQMLHRGKLLSVEQLRRIIGRGRPQKTRNSKQ